MRVLYFGSAREAAGTREEAMALPEGATVAALLDRAARDHEGLRAASRALGVAVNESLVGPGRRLKEGDEVALLPPIAGG